MIAAPIFETENGEKDMEQNKVSQMHEFQLLFNNNTSFKIKVSLIEEKQKIFLSAIENQDFIRKEYKTLLSLQELITKNKQFKSFDNIYEAFNLIIKLFEKKKILIKDYKEEDKRIKLEVKLLSLSGDEQSFIIDLYQKEINKDILIEQLITKVISLEREIIEIKKSNEERDKEIESLKNIINEIKNNNINNNNNNRGNNLNNNIINNLNNIIDNNNINNNNLNNNINNRINNNINNNNKNENLIKINSKIVNEKNIEFIIEQLKLIYKINNNDNKIIKTKLLYRGSRDGFEPRIFHSKCDNIKGTMILIENDKKIKFGGFTKESWDGEHKAKKDEDAFCFSISLKKIYKVKQNEDAIRCDPKYGPVFLNDIFGFRNNDLEVGEAYVISNCHYSGIESDFEINGFEKKINVTELEVFQIIFD